VKKTPISSFYSNTKNIKKRRTPPIPGSAAFLPLCENKFKIADIFQDGRRIQDG
jgi:hypothetical protein